MKFSSQKLIQLLNVMASCFVIFFFTSCQKRPIPQTRIAIILPSSISLTDSANAGTPKTIMVKNVGDAIAFNVTAQLPGTLLLSGLTVTPCQDKLLPGDTCLLTFTPKNPVNETNFPIRGSNTNILQGTVVVLGLGSSYQGGTVFALDPDTTASCNYSTLNETLNGCTKVWFTVPATTLAETAMNRPTALGAPLPLSQITWSPPGAANPNQITTITVPGTPPNSNLFNGFLNTGGILSVFPTSQYPGITYAAQSCFQTTSTSNSYLPSICELTNTGFCSSIGLPQTIQSSAGCTQNLPQGFYWSSTEIPDASGTTSSNAYAFPFTTNIFATPKISQCNKSSSSCTYGGMTGKTYAICASIVVPPPQPNPPLTPNGGTIICPESSQCLTVGSYLATGSKHSLLLESTGNGGIAFGPFGGTTPVALPSDYNSSMPAELTNISCQSGSTSTCFAVGNYNQSVPLLATNSANSISSYLGRSMINFLPTNNNGNAQLTGISCLTSLECFAVGIYQTTSLTFLPYVIATTDGWNTVFFPDSQSTTPPSSSNMISLPANQSALITGISCSDALNCFAVGQVIVSGTPNTLVISTNNGWKAGSVSVMNITITSFSGGQALTGITCLNTATGTGPSKSCYAVGFYNGVSGGPAPFVVKTSDGWNTVAPIIKITPPSNAAIHNNAKAVLTGLTCTDINSCIAVGFYNTNSSQQLPFSVKTTSGWSSGSTTTSQSNVTLPFDYSANLMAAFGSTLIQPP